MDAIKLEGGAPSRITAAKAIVEAGIAVIRHVGLTPQAISVLGGFRRRNEAGCFSVDLECVPAPVAAATTSALRIPTIGIGAGPFCSGQALVYHDLLGMMQHPHHAKVTPKFCKQFGQVGDVINKALLEYKEEVTNGSFPGSAHSPYKIGAADMVGFLNALQKLVSMMQLQQQLKRFRQANLPDQQFFSILVANKCYYTELYLAVSRRWGEDS
ncbi:hypothetical protein KY284_008582 [Solanum tuberosum]|nr:hypothetical protein KY284_008582 [Solanum tuberosum]